MPVAVVMPVVWALVMAAIAPRVSSEISCRLLKGCLLGMEKPPGAARSRGLGDWLLKGC